MNQWAGQATNITHLLNYTSNLFETCFMVASDDLKGKTNHFTGFYTNSISRQKILNPGHKVTQRDAIAMAILNHTS